MNPQDILRYVDSLNREKNIDPSYVFTAIEAAYATGAKRQYGEEAAVVVSIDRASGRISATLNGESLSEETIGRIGAQTAKQVIIQKVREAERDALIDEYRDQVGQLVTGTIQRVDGGVATVQLGNVEAILPRSEQIPGESLHPNERTRAVVFEVRAAGNRVKVVLSRTRPQLVQRLFEQEIPELADGVISIDAISREPGYRSKVAVSTTDPRVDPIAVCVGYHGARIKAVRNELAGEHIDVIRHNTDPNVMIPNALQPAKVEQVLLCDMIGRAIVLVQEDQLSLAIGRRGQNVRLASKLCGWDIEIMTHGELEEKLSVAVEGFCQIEGIDEDLAQRLVEQGYLSYDDLSVIEPDSLVEMGGLTADQVDRIVEQAEAKAEEAEAAAAEERRQRRDRDRGDRGDEGSRGEGSRGEARTSESRGQRPSVDSQVDDAAVGATPSTDGHGEPEANGSSIDDESSLGDSSSTEVVPEANSLINDEAKDGGGS
jgi:transcription termination/antitermination protein NusA